MTTATDTGPRYQITTFEAYSQFSREAGQSIHAGLTWQDVAERLSKAPEADVDYAMASLPTVGRYSYHDASGKLNTILLAK